MDDVRGRILGLPHSTTPSAVTTNKNIKISSFKSSENLQKKEGGPDRSVSIMFTNVHFLEHESFHTKFGSEWHSRF